MNKTPDSSLSPSIPLCLLMRARPISSTLRQNWVIALFKVSAIGSVSKSVDVGEDSSIYLAVVFFIEFKHGWRTTIHIFSQGMVDSGSR